MVRLRNILFDYRLERAATVVVSQLHTRRVEWNRAGFFGDPINLILRNVEKFGFVVDESSYEPRTRYPIYVHVRASDPFHFVSPFFELFHSDCDHIDNKRDKREPCSHLFPVRGLRGWAECGIAAERNIGNDRAKHIIRAKRRNGVIVQLRYVPSQPPKEHRYPND